MLKSIKKYIIGFVIGILFSGTFSYAANGGSGTIGRLFEFLGGNNLENSRPVNNVYRLDGRNVRDNTITSYEIEDNGIKTIDIGNFQVTNSKLADNSVSSNNIINDTITEADISNTFISRNSYRLQGRDTESTLSGNDSKIPTSKAVKNYLNNNSGIQLFKKSYNKYQFINASNFKGTNIYVYCPPGKKIIMCSAPNPYLLRHNNWRFSKQMNVNTYAYAGNSHCHVKTSFFSSGSCRDRGRPDENGDRDDECTSDNHDASSWPYYFGFLDSNILEVSILCG